jgi:hypothetical protein
MNLNDYQQAALRTAAPKDKPNELFHLLLGLMGETGEIAEKAKKIVRDKDSDFSQWTKRISRRNSMTRSGISLLLQTTLMSRWKMSLNSTLPNLPTGRSERDRRQRKRSLS